MTHEKVILGLGPVPNKPFTVTDRLRQIQSYGPNLLPNACVANAQDIIDRLTKEGVFLQNEKKEGRGNLPYISVKNQIPR